MLRFVLMPNLFQLRGKTMKLTPVVWLHFDALFSEYFAMNFGKSHETEIGEFNQGM